jgi:hypothetical protein
MLTNSDWSVAIKMTEVLKLNLFIHNYSLVLFLFYISVAIGFHY